MKLGCMKRVLGRSGRFRLRNFAMEITLIVVNILLVLTIIGIWSGFPESESNSAVKKGVLEEMTFGHMTGTDPGSTN